MLGTPYFAGQLLCLGPCQTSSFQSCQPELGVGVGVLGPVLSFTRGETEQKGTGLCLVGTLHLASNAVNWYQAQVIKQTRDLRKWPELCRKLLAGGSSVMVCWGGWAGKHGGVIVMKMLGF